MTKKEWTEGVSGDISPIGGWGALTPEWVNRIQEFDGLEIHPCAVAGRDKDNRIAAEICEPQRADFWEVCGRYRTGGVDAFEDFATEAEARAFRDKLTASYPHLAGEPVRWPEAREYEHEGRERERGHERVR